jgi:GT2 family glycosyltransferase
MTISVVIPNYNGEKIIKKNLPKVLEAVGNVEVVIVDDASTDASASVISNFKSQISNLKFFQNKHNLGFPATVNKGVKEAEGEIIILLNTDVIPEKGFLNPLLSHFSDNEVFAVGCMDKSIEGDRTILRGRGIGKWKRGFLIHSRGEINKTDTLWINGGSGAFRKSVWNKLDGLNPLYSPFYWEDIDLSYRALKSGYKIIFEPKSMVVHEHEKGAIKDAFSDSEVKTIAYRNQLIFVWKNITDFSMKLGHLFWLPYHILSAVLRGDSAFIRGIIDAFILLPKIIKYKDIEHGHFVLKDSQVLSPFKGEK